MPIDLSAVGKEMPPSTFEYTEQDVMLYALGVGATTEELDFIYEKNLKVLPTYAVIAGMSAMGGMMDVLQGVNPAMLVHGEQRIELRGPLPTSGKLSGKGRISAIYDKGSGALLVIDSETKDESGNVLFTNSFGAFIRGEGGFGGERGPSASSKNVPPERAPDHTSEYKTSPDQAAIYRLSGDRNPLHIDPAFAKMAGYDTPILHGLCTLGHAGRAVMATYCDNDPARMTGLEVRFSGVVFPGDSIITEMWDEGNGRIVLQAKTQRGDVVISNASATVK